jgi:hypothetical protein
MLTYKRVRMVMISHREYVAVIIFEVIGEMKMCQMICESKRKVYEGKGLGPRRIISPSC